MKGSEVAGQPDPRQMVGAIIVAAGHSKRMGGLDKIFAPLIDRPLLWYSLKVLHDCPQVDAIVVVLSHVNLGKGRKLVEENGWHKVREVCAGGDRRQDSVMNGLDRLRDTEWIVVHDGARPCLTADMIPRGLAEAQKSGATAAAVPAKDTTKLANEELEVIETLARDRLWTVQTPQVFRTRLLAEAHEKSRSEATDDASMVEEIGGTVRLFMGSYSNLKVTTTEDIRMAEVVLQSIEQSARTAAT